jgi:hypothetical protein
MLSIGSILGEIGPVLPRYGDRGSGDGGVVVINDENHRSADCFFSTLSM